MIGAALAVLAIQAVLMGVDEIVFHSRRGLSRWERIGHPIDSVVLAAALTVPALQPHDGGALALYVTLAIFSALCVTKDELIHSRECGGLEQWIHSLLFLNHGAILFLAGMLWARGLAPELRLALPLLALGCGCAQALRWLVLPYVRERKQDKQRLLRHAG